MHRRDFLKTAAAGAAASLTAAASSQCAPVSDRRALGPVGMPAVALLGALALLVAAGLAKTLLPLVAQTLVLVVMAMVALLWLRRALHLGLLQESREAAVEGDIRCPNCGVVTPEHTFCGNCGISLRALPTGRRPAAPADGPPVAKPQA